MRPKNKSWSFSAADADGFLGASSGTGPWYPTTTSPPDGCNHKVTLTSAADLHTINFTIYGYTDGGLEETETLAGPLSNTVTGAKYFSQIVSIEASATTGASTFTVGWTTECTTRMIPISAYTLSQLRLEVAPGGTVTYSVEEFVHDVFSVSANTLSGTLVGTSGASAAQWGLAGTSGTTGWRARVGTHVSGTMVANWVQGRAT